MLEYYARDLRQKIEVLQQVRTADGSGGRFITYTPMVPPVIIRAKVHPLSASESMVAGRISSSERVEVIIRYRTGLSQNMRVKYGLRTFEVVGIVDLNEGHRWMRLDCEERMGE